MNLSGLSLSSAGCESSYRMQEKTCRHHHNYILLHNGLFLGFEVTELPEPGKTNKFHRLKYIQRLQKQNFVFYLLKFQHENKRRDR